MSDDDNDIDVLLDKTLCKTCYYYLYREVRPFEETREQWEEEFNIEIGEDSVIETHTCLLVSVDLDHVVYKCNKYMSNQQAAFNTNIRLFK